MNDNINIELEKDYYRCKTDRDSISKNKNIYLKNLIENMNHQANEKYQNENNLNDKGCESSYCNYNLIDHLIVNKNELKILFDHQIRNLFAKYSKSNNNILQQGLRVVLGLFLFNLIFNKRKLISDINEILTILEYISIKKIKSKKMMNKKSELKNNSQFMSLNDEKYAEYLIISHKMSKGFINIIRKLLQNEEIINLYNLKEFFERQEIGIKNMGKFSLNIQNLIEGLYFGKCWEICNEHQISNFTEFKNNLTSKI